MFKTRKFREGDEVSLLDNLSSRMTVKKSYWQEEGWGVYDEKVVLDDDNVYNERKLTFYSEPVTRLASENIRLKASLERLGKDLDKFKESVMGKNEVSWGLSGLSLVNAFARIYTIESSPQQSLKERIEKLEEITTKKVVKKKKRKTKKKK